MLHATIYTWLQQGFWPISFMAYIDVNPAEFWGRFVTKGVGWFMTWSVSASLQSSVMLSYNTSRYQRAFALFGCDSHSFSPLPRRRNLKKIKCNQPTITSFLQVDQRCSSAEFFSKDILSLCCVSLQKPASENREKNKHKQALHAVKSIC